jgi:hypothetical protein
MRSAQPRRPLFVDMGGQEAPKRRRPVLVLTVLGLLLAAMAYSLLPVWRGTLAARAHTPAIVNTESVAVPLRSEDEDEDASKEEGEEGADNDERASSGLPVNGSLASAAAPSDSGASGALPSAHAASSPAATPSTPVTPPSQTRSPAPPSPSSSPAPPSPSATSAASSPPAAAAPPASGVPRGARLCSLPAVTPFPAGYVSALVRQARALGLTDADVPDVNKRGREQVRPLPLLLSGSSPLSCAR